MFGAVGEPDLAEIELLVWRSWGRQIGEIDLVTWDSKPYLDMQKHN